MFKEQLPRKEMLCSFLIGKKRDKGYEHALKVWNKV